MLVRKAKLPDASNIYHLVNSLSSDGTLLRRGFAEICENVRDFTVVETEEGDFLGCGALHLYGPHLAEVRSIVVDPEAQRQGAGGGESGDGEGRGVRHVEPEPAARRVVLPHPRPSEVREHLPSGVRRHQRRLVTV